MVEIKHYSFGFPQNVTVNYTADTLEEIKSQNYSNKNVNVKLTLDKLQKKNFNKEVLEEEIKQATKASRVKVTFVFNQNTNIRSREVTDKTDIVEKFKAYAELNQIKYQPTLLDKLNTIQENMLIESFTPHESFTLEYMSIRGAIGIMDGQHKEEISLDLVNGFDEGIIGITGKSGSGKSTLLENMHPYPCMLSRGGSLKDHFCLKDSHRILIYRSSTGRRYKIEMLINGTAKAIGTIYKVSYKDEDKDWEPIRSIDGSNESYVNWVNNTFGPKNLFLRTSFYTNAAIKNFPDLSQATKSDKMELFSILAGTDFLSEIANTAKQKAKDENDIIENIKSQIKDFDTIETQLSENTLLIEENSKNIQSYTEALENDTKELDKYNELQKEFIKCQATYDIYRNQLSEKRAELDNTQRAQVQSDMVIQGIQQQIDDMDMYKEQIAWYEENMAKRKNLVSKEQEIRERFSKLQTELDLKEKEYNKHLFEKMRCEEDVKRLPLEIRRLESAIPTIDGNCPMCGAPLSSHKKEQLEKEIVSTKVDISNLKKDLDEKQEIVKQENEWLTQNSLQNYKSNLSNLTTELTSISNDITDIDTYADQLDIDTARDVVSNAQNMMTSEMSRNNDIKEKLHQLTDTVEQLEHKLNEIPIDYSDKIARLTRGIDNSKEQISQLNAEITFAQKELDRLSEYKDKIQSVKSEIKTHQQNAKDYELIHVSFGNNGIQALELDSAAPEISDIANSILLDTYGDRFSISFDTQRDTKDGRKIDDFIINVFDSEAGRMKRLDLISSGEGTLIKQTLYYAFSVIRTRKTGFCFKTRFLDESDSALDSELRVKYLKMIESAHNQCGAVQTILITHSQELKDIIEQKIEL